MTFLKTMFKYMFWEYLIRAILEIFIFAYLSFNLSTILYISIFFYRCFCLYYLSIYLFIYLSIYLKKAERSAELWTMTNCKRVRPRRANWTIIFFHLTIIIAYCDDVKMNIHRFLLFKWSLLADWLSFWN